MGWKGGRGEETKKKKKKGEKKWEEDEAINQRRFRRQEHQTAWLKFQHSCHGEEASWPKGQNKNHCDAQRNVFTLFP